MPGWELIGVEERDAVKDVFLPNPTNGMLMLDPVVVRDFECAFASALQTPYAVAVSSGSAALKVALKACGVGPGDEVITQCHTFVATVEAILECGATPVLTEIDETLNMDMIDLAWKITPRTKVILPVHMLGVGAHILKIRVQANGVGCALVEDTAQALGGTASGQPLGTFGEFGTFSFSASKILTTGDGGMMVCGRPDLLSRARAYMDHGHDRVPGKTRGDDTHTVGGFNYRMGAFAAAMGLAQLKKLPTALMRHRANKARLKEAITVQGMDWFWREVPDPHGDSGDALVFFLETEAQARKVAARLMGWGVSLKNLPDALNWHFAGCWEHLLGPSAATMFPQSNAILRRTIALQIFAQWDEPAILKLADLVWQAVAEVQ